MTIDVTTHPAMNVLSGQFVRTRLERVRLVQVEILIRTSSGIRGTMDSVTDYSDPSNWAYFGEGPDKGADVFLIAPTSDFTDSRNMSLMMRSRRGSSGYLWRWRGHL